MTTKSLITECREFLHEEAVTNKQLSNAWTFLNYISDGKAPSLATIKNRVDGDKAKTKALMIKIVTPFLEKAKTLPHFNLPKLPNLKGKTPESALGFDYVVEPQTVDKVAKEAATGDSIPSNFIAAANEPKIKKLLKVYGLTPADIGAGSFEQDDEGFDRVLLNDYCFYILSPKEIKKGEFGTSNNEWLSKLEKQVNKSVCLVAI